MPRMKVQGQHHRSIEADPSTRIVRFIDQTRLPHAFVLSEATHWTQIESAIRDMAVRGAPLIGVAAAFGLALAMTEDASDDQLNLVSQRLNATRPTAVNLAWALERMTSHLQPLLIENRQAAAWREAQAIADEDVAINEAIGRHTLPLIQAIAQKKDVVNILTHCNAGWPATVDWGTALSGIYQAQLANIRLHVWVDETRPRSQGLLTAWELREQGVPHTFIADNAGGHLMQHGQVDMVIVGADRVSLKGDVCNKIGTYLKALAAFDNGIPFYAAVPSPTIDRTLRDALGEIEIEERAGSEVRRIQGLDADGQLTSLQLLPEGSPVSNPGFDVTPARLVTGIITEKGVAAAGELARLFG
jgi:methylthioribose-1-phosphate isomerase